MWFIELPAVKKLRWDSVPAMSQKRGIAKAIF
jgi:hypothetical protein